MMTVRGKSSPLFFLFFCAGSSSTEGKKRVLSFQRALPSLLQTPSFMGQEHVFKHMPRFCDMFKCR